jgi:hypothetical protein
MQFIYSYNTIIMRRENLISFNLMLRGPPHNIISIQCDEVHMPACCVLEVVHAHDFYLSNYSNCIDSTVTYNGNPPIISHLF